MSDLYHVAPENDLESYIRHSTQLTFQQIDAANA